MLTDAVADRKSYINQCVCHEILCLAQHAAINVRSNTVSTVAAVSAGNW